MPAMRLAVTETTNAFRESTMRSNKASPGSLGVYWRLSGNAHVLRDVCDDYATHNGTGLWRNEETVPVSHPWCLCTVLPAFEDSDAFIPRLMQWLHDPSSQPDLEHWHQMTGRQFLHRPSSTTVAMPGVGSRTPASAGPGATQRPGATASPGGAGGSGGIGAPPIPPGGGSPGPGAGAGGGGGGVGVPPTGIGGGGSDDPDGDPFLLLMNDLASSQRVPTDAEVDLIRRHVASVGFDPNAQERARGELAGEVWQGQTLKGTDLLPPDVRHFVKHVQKRKEWPADIIEVAQYTATLADIILDNASGILLGRYLGASWQVTFIRRSYVLRGSGGHEWVMVDYRLDTGHWVTAFQFPDPLDDVPFRSRSDTRWLRQPR